MIEVTGTQVISLSDNTPCTIVSYTEDGVAKMESQVWIAGEQYPFKCWQITNPSLLTYVTLPQYMSPNAAGAIPAPKGSNNPGGSPIKY